MDFQKLHKRYVQLIIDEVWDDESVWCFVRHKAHTFGPFAVRRAQRVIAFYFINLLH
jgi:hypothetical protein